MPNKTIQHVNYNGTTYDIDAVTVNEHTVQSNVPANYDWDKSKVELSNLTASGDKVGDITIDGTLKTLYSPKYTGTSPILISGTAISHTTSGITAATYGTIATTEITPTFGGKFSIPGFTVNATGHVTAAATHDVTLPSLSVTQVLGSTGTTKIGTITINGTSTDFYAPTNTNTWDQYGGATANAAGTAGYVPGAAANQLFQYFAGNGTWRGAPTASGELGLITYEEKTKLAAIADGADNVSYSATKTSGIELGKININGDENNIIYAPNYTGTAPISVGSDYKITHATSGPSSSGDTSKGDTSNQTPNFGATFKVTSATVNKYGHTTALAEHTVQMPSLTNTPTYDSGTLIDTLTINGTQSQIYIPAYPTVESLGLSKALKFIGFSSSAITDGQTTAPTITGVNNYTPAVGDVVIDGSDATATSQWEYVYTSANKWERLGGDASYVIGGTEYDVTNGGTNDSSSVSITPSTTQVYSMTSAGSVTPGNEASLTMSVTDEKLTFNFDANTPTLVTLPGRSSVINAWTGYTAATAAAQTFHPTTKKITIN